MNNLQDIPEQVCQSVRNYCQGRNLDATNIILHQLRYDTLNRCFYFWHDEVYVGIEMDGYLHT